MFVSVVIEYIPIMIECMVYSITVRNLILNIPMLIYTLKCLDMHYSNNNSS